MNYESQSTTLAEIKALLKSTKSEQEFIGHIEHYLALGLPVQLTKTWSPSFGWSFTASIFAANILTRSNAYLAWTLRLPRTAEAKGSMRRQTSLSFFGKISSLRQDERNCRWKIKDIIEINQQFPREGLGIDGMPVKVPAAAPVAEALPENPEGRGEAPAPAVEAITITLPPKGTPLPGTSGVRRSDLPTSRVPAYNGDPRAWATEMWSLDFQFHLDDEPADMTHESGEPMFTPEECVQLRAIVDMLSEDERETIFRTWLEFLHQPGFND